MIGVAASIETVCDLYSFPRWTNFQRQHYKTAHHSTACSSLVVGWGGRDEKAPMQKDKID